MNKVFLIGNLTRDPELTETNSGNSLCRFSIAVNRKYSGADGETKTDFFNCVAWRSLAETAATYLHKGNKVAVIGSIELRNYEDSEGIKRTAVDIVAQDLEFLTPRKADNNDNEVERDVPRGNSHTSGQRSQQQLIAFDDDGDIPF